MHGTSGPGRDLRAWRDDEIWGRGGNDIIYVGRGNDFLAGGAGDDRVYGGAGRDGVGGMGEDDRLFGQRGRDDVYAERGADVLFGGDGRDHLVPWTAGAGTTACSEALAATLTARAAESARSVESISCEG